MVLARTICVVLTMLSAPLQERGQRDLNYAVYNTLLNLMQLPKAKPSVVISALTQNSHCGEKAGGIVLMNGCGIWIPPATRDGIHRELLASWPQLDASTWDDFEVQNRASSTPSDQFTTPWPHRVINIYGTNALPKPLDGVVLLSNVGFSATKTQAMVYSLFLSYMPGVPTSANLFVFTLGRDNRWLPSARITLMQTQN